MKKIVLALIAGLAFGAAAFADHPGTLGVGGVLGGGYGGDGTNFNLGLSLKHPAAPVFWGLYARVQSGSMGLGVTGDYYIYEENFIDKIETNEDGSYHVKIDWYLGLGLFGNADFVTVNKETYTSFGVGLRIPFGLSWHALKYLEVAAGFAPGFGYSFHSGGDASYWVIPFELAVRYWFDQ